MTGDLSPDAVALLNAGLLQDGYSEVDEIFFQLRSKLTASRVREALEELAEHGFVTREVRWACQCGSRMPISTALCIGCGEVRPETTAASFAFCRPKNHRRRDPAALFLVHGMNTLGDWQQSFAWRVHLLYGYSVPVFVFKFGKDRLSPLTRWAQRRRTKQLGVAVRAARDDLQAAGRVTVCDVVAHSFGTLMLARLLEDPDFADLRFGRIVLTGAIVRSTFDWRSLIDSGRVEAVLNHVGGRDEWVGRAPWVFPDTSPTGLLGMTGAEVQQIVSPDLRHSDFFEDSAFAIAIRDLWTPFLNGSTHAPATALEARAAIEFVRNRNPYWIGRAVLFVLFAAAAAVMLVALANIGEAIARVLEVLGLGSLLLGAN